MSPHCVQHPTTPHFLPPLVFRAMRAGSESHPSPQSPRTTLVFQPETTGSRLWDVAQGFPWSGKVTAPPAGLLHESQPASQHETGSRRQPHPGKADCQGPLGTMWLQGHLQSQPASQHQSGRLNTVVLPPPPPPPHARKGLRADWSIRGAHSRKEALIPCYPYSKRHSRAFTPPAVRKAVLRNLQPAPGVPVPPRLALLKPKRILGDAPRRCGPGPCLPPFGYPLSR